MSHYAYAGTADDEDFYACEVCGELWPCECSEDDVEHWMHQASLEAEPR